MIEYEYREKFGNHKRVDWIIVPAGTVITPVSGEDPDIPEGTAYIIDTEHLISESISIKESICSSKNLKFGQMEESYISFVIANDNIPLLADEMIDIYIYFDQDSDTIFQVGQYIVDKDQYTVDRRQRTIQAFDAIKNLKDWDITEWYNDYFSDGQRHMIGLVLVSLFNWIRDEQDEYKDSPKLPVYLNPDYVLCNGLFAIGRTIESDTITFGFFMSGLLEFNGCFGHIGRDGRFNCLTLSSYDKEPVRTVTDALRLSPASYEDINTWGIGQIDVYDRNNIKKFSVQNTAKKHPNIYVMADPFVLADRDAGDQDVIAALKKLHEVIIHLNYAPNQTECTGDLSVEVGDRYNVQFTRRSEYDTKNWYRSYVLERTFSGIQSFKDTYTAKGDKKQPKYTITNDRWHTGDSTDSSTQGEGGVSSIDAEEDRKLIAKQRNYGEPMLDEPTDVEVVYNKSSQQVEIKWTDPDDIDTYTPLPVEWEGTVVVRKEGSPPLHPFGNIDEYGGTIIETETTKNTYQSTAFVDDTIEPNKKYYYAIMPYFVKLDDADHPINQYRWTKCVSVDTERILIAPTIYPIQDTQISGTTVTVAYTIPTLTEGSYTVQKLVVKKDSIPTSKTDGDKIIDLTPDPTMLINGVEVSGLDENSTYYFVIFIEDEIGSSASSEPQSATTGADEGWNFGYTGEEEVFTAPKTGIYQIETWGAQGGNATDGTMVARGGYGAYAVGEVLLQQGDTLYINVGGQNGYGGGGNPVTNIINIIKNNTYNPDATPQGIDITNNVATYAISSGSGSWTLVNSQLSEYLLTNKTLICYMSGNIRYSLASDGIFRRSSNRPSMATHTFIPVNRQINLQKLHFKHKDYSRYGDYFQGTVGVGYVENGEFKMGATMDLDLRSTAVSDWTSKEIDLSSVPYIDYIYIVWYDGCEDFKDFEIEYI